MRKVVRNMNILVTGASGFIGNNLCLKLEELGYYVYKIDRKSTKEELAEAVHKANFIFHLAGVNRPLDESEFIVGNTDSTKVIVDMLMQAGLRTPIMLSSSTQAELDNPYGVSKRHAEEIIKNYGVATNSHYYIYRFPNVFGKWCKPNYNSFVATFCYNIASDKPITINDPDAEVTLVYIDDVCSDLISLIKGADSGYQLIEPQYQTTVGDVAKVLYSFKNSRDTLITEPVGSGLCRALYSTWLTYISPESFSYSVPSYSDPRGTFCEMLKTQDSGQFSFFTAYPGVTRGGHYHHSKNEKFLVIQGRARFKFEHVITGQKHELIIEPGEYRIVETVPGWSHDITNIGNNELVVMLWANEIFDRDHPDTIARAL